MSKDTALGQALANQGRSQQWLAVQVSARLGRPIVRQQITRWVAGSFQPEARTREAIADALGVTAQSLWTDHVAEVPTDLTDADDPASATGAAA